MKCAISIFLYFFWPVAIACASVGDHVDPFIGTEQSEVFSLWRMEGGTYPGAVAPHGMIQVTPETSVGKDFLKGYYYLQDTIYRFSLVDHLSGWPSGSAGKVTLMPGYASGNLDELKMDQLGSRFSHDNEQATPGYYRVHLQDSKIECTFSSLTRSAIGVFEFKGDGDPVVALGRYKSLKQVSQRELQITSDAGNYGMGNQYTIHLRLIFDQPFKMIKSAKSAVLSFEGDVIRFKCGVSYTSPNNARLNVGKEIPGWDFSKVVATSRALWDEQLSKILVEGGTEADKTMFYTAFYHASLLPIAATDVNREYPGFEQNEALKDGEIHYIYFTPWDAFRTLHPMINLVDPVKGRDYMRSIVRFHNSFGRLPEPLVMTSVHMSMLVADAIAKGITDFDVPTAYQALRKMIYEEPYFREDMALFREFGHVPYPQRFATTATLEFSLNDWALAQVARHMGDTRLALKLEQESLNYRNNYLPQTRFMQTRNKDGSWAKASMYAEADKWNMSWLVPHNLQDLINLMGGDEAFVQHLENIFLEEHYVLDNENPINFPFLFSYAGAPEKSMKWARSVLREHFNTSPGGISGNDDWGTMSSWFMLVAMGIFPASPGTDEWIISGPLFEKVLINQGSGKEIHIHADSAGEENIYVQELRLDGELLNTPFITHQQLTSGALVNFTMGRVENPDFGKDHRPYSLFHDKPDLEVDGFMLLDSKIKSGEVTVAKVSIVNHGAMGSYNLVIIDEVDVIHQQWVLLDEGERRTVTTPVRIFKEGEHVLKCGDSVQRVDVKYVPLSPQEALEAGEIRCAHFVDEGDPVVLKGTVMNRSGRDILAIPKLYLNGKLKDALTPVALKPGEKTKVVVNLSTSGLSGIQEVRINSGPVTRFKVIHDAADALALHYTFDDDKSLVRDHSGFGHHGRTVGGVRYKQGVAGKGISFEDGYVEIPDSPVLDITGSELTMMCWYKPSEEQDKASMVTRGAHNMLKLNGKWQVSTAIGGWGRGQCTYNAKSGDQAGKPEWFEKWTHFASRRDSRSLSVYTDGQRRNRLTHKGFDIFESEFEWRVGSNAEIPVGRTPDGVLDEVRIYARALSDAEISRIFEDHSN